MKELYTKPVVELDEFEAVDVMTASGENTGNIDNGAGGRD